MKKLLNIALSTIIAAGILTGCGSSATETADTTAAQSDASADTENATEAEGSAEADAATDENIEGTITMNGSTSMEKFANALNESFMNKYPGVQATVEFTGSGAGIEAVTNGTVDIGNSSRALTDEEKANGLVENVVAIDGIGIVVNPATTVDDVTTDQLKEIYTGAVTNWSELGGEDSQIVVIGREASSGTRSAFEEILGVEDQCQYAQEIDSTGAVMAKVASTPGAIGYVSIDIIDDTVKTLKLDGVEPTQDTIKDGSYTLQRPFVMATKGEISEQSEAVQALFDYINSDEGQDIIAQVGLISAKQ